MGSEGKREPAGGLEKGGKDRRQAGGRLLAQERTPKSVQQDKSLVPGRGPTA